VDVRDRWRAQSRRRTRAHLTHVRGWANHLISLTAAHLSCRCFLVTAEGWPSPDVNAPPLLFTGRLMIGDMFEMTAAACRTETVSGSGVALGAEPKAIAPAVRLEAVHAGDVDAL